MSNTFVTSLAILMVNEEQNLDYYDNFVPIVAETIRCSSSDVISVPEIKAEIKNRFKLDLPHNVLNTIIRRRLEKKGYVSKKRSVLIPNRENLAKLNFSSFQQQILELHEQLIHSLCNYAHKYYQIAWDQLQAEEAFEIFLKENELLLVRNGQQNNYSGEDSKAFEKKAKFIVAKYVNHLEQNQSVLFRYLEQIVKGDMLANAIYLTNPSHIQQKFSNTQVYFDTTFIIFALGYAGEARQHPCRELINLLKESKATLRCFRHNIDEVVGILEGCQNRLKNNFLNDNYGTMEYFVQNGFTTADIERLISTIDENIKTKLNIEVVEKPPYIKTFNIDEKGLNKYLSSEIHYQRETALDRDVDSISAIYRIRRGHKSMHVEDCRGLFVTTNNALVKSSRKFFLSEGNSRTIPPVVSDHFLTNLLWLKKPTQAPDLPRKRIIADCIAAIQPDDYIWKKYLDKIEQLEKEKQVTEEEYYLLRSSQESRSAFMEKTFGEDQVFTQGTVQEILELLKTRLITEKQQEIDHKDLQIHEKDKQIQNAQSELSQYQQQAAENDSKIFRKIERESKKHAVIWSRIIAFLTVLTLSTGFCLTISCFQDPLPSWLKMTINIFFLVALPVSSLFGFTFIKPLQKFENHLAQNKMDKLRRFYLDN